MSRNPSADSHRRPGIGAVLLGLALTALLALTVAPASARHGELNAPIQAAATGQTTSGAAPTTVLKETVVKHTNSDPALPIVLSAAALAVALGAAALTLARRTVDRSTRRA
jgi:hypothetical protein